VREPRSYRKTGNHIVIVRKPAASTAIASKSFEKRIEGKRHTHCDA